MSCGSFIVADQYNALMALCAGKAESKGRVEAARVLINRGAIVNSHDRYMFKYMVLWQKSKCSEWVWFGGVCVHFG